MASNSDLQSQDLKSQVRKPQCRVTANGKALRIVQAEVIQNGHQEADSFDVQMPLFDPQAPYDWKWWAEQTDIEIEVLLGFADKDGQTSRWTSLVQGPVDSIAMSPLAYGPHSNLALRARTEVGRGGQLPHETGPAHPYGAVLQIRGRDYSGQLIDSEVSQEQVSGNLTSKDMLDNLVSQVPGLSLDISQLDDDSVGDLMNDAQGRLTLHRSAWDVISGIAEHEGARATVKGKQVKIAPVPADSSDKGQAFAIYYYPEKQSSTGGGFEPVRSNVMTLRMARALAVGRGVDHFVQAYDSATGRRPSRAVARVRSQQRESRSDGDKMNSNLTYTESQPGMSQAQARKHARAKGNHVSKFERDIEFQMPGDLTLTVDTPVTLTGTGTQFDQTYEVSQLTHFFDLTQGYRMECRCRNRSDDVQVQVEDAPKQSQAFGSNDPPSATQLAQVPHYP